ncbi:MAG TPA: tripartite tricarboxylate transporter substrate binding protein [Burkholderiales bacterium]|nr:tripartite tricarboxylate transporter substrate binding protein [Burkholderiales bacterium]
MKNLARLLAALTLAAAPLSYAQQQYPVKPVRVIVPFAAGGPSDFLMRIVGPKLTEIWGHTVILDNRGGANQQLGSELAARAPADGYTLLMMTGGAAINVTLYPKLPYDTLRDFAPISLVAVGPNMAVIHPSVPAKNLAEFITFARSKPKQIVYASAGAGAPSHLAVELFSTMAKIQMIHVPYKGMAPGMTDLLGGQVQLAFPTISAGIPHIRSGKLRALGVTTAKRSPAAPDVPTIAEAALPGFEASNWYGMVAPGKTPPELVRKIHDDLAKVLASPDVREKFINQGMEATSITPEAFQAHIRSEIAKWAKVVKASGARPE